MFGIRTKSDDNFHTIAQFSESSSNPCRLKSKLEYIAEYKSRVFACVNVIGNWISGLEYSLTKNDKSIKHEYLNLITEDTLYGIVAFLQLCGNAYLRKILIGKTVKQLEFLRPDKVWFKNGKYTYTHNGSIIELEKEEVIAFKNFNPLAPSKYSSGFGTVQGCAITIDSEYASEVWNWKFFEQGDWAKTMKNNNANLGDDEIARFAEQYKNSSSGVNNAHQIIVLPNGIEPTESSPHQKEADFAEHQKLSRDKILAIFNVPKAILGMAENVNVWNVEAFDAIFAKRTLLPLAKRIARALNEQLFNEVGSFEFVNILPVNEEEIRAEYKEGIITLNEARQAMGWDTLANGDTFNNWEVALQEKPLKKERQLSDEVLKIIRKWVAGTKENDDEKKLEERHKSYEKRLDGYEKKLKKWLLDIFKQQEEDILTQYSGKSVKENIPQLNSSKYLTIYIEWILDIFKWIFEIEANEALHEVKPDDNYILDVLDNMMIRTTVQTLARTIDDTTNKKIVEIISEGLTNGLGPAEIRDWLQLIFRELSTTRASTIVRTETVNLTTKSQIKARSKVGIQKKRRYTAIDERVCPFCNSMHDKIMELEEDYYKQGDSLSVDDTTLKFDYTSIKGPPLHPSCRCSLLAIVDE